MESETEPAPARPLCTCNWLHDQAARPEVPIEFDPEVNEFHLHAGNHHFLIYYCPLCGGRAPDSLRPTFFTIVPPEEAARLEKLAEPLTSREEALRILGPPDRERHTLTYQRLSDTANVIAIIDNGIWRGVFHTEKNVEPKRGGNAEA